MYPQQQQPAYPPNGTNNQPQYGWSNPGYPPNMPSYQPNMPTPGYPPQIPPQQIPVQPTTPGPNAFFSVDTETPVCLFSEKTIRMAFIRKVCAILMCQLAVTVVFIAIFVYQPKVNAFARAHGWLVWVAFAFVFILLIVISCCEGLRRKWPTNIILLGFFTICEGFMLGLTSAFYEKDEVLMAFGICTVVCLALTIFATQTKWDFTMMRGMLFVCSIILLIFGIAAICFQNRIVSLVYCSLGAILFSVYLVYDIQCMVGGANRKNAVSPEEYIFAALSIYIDIVNIFMSILGIIGLSKN